MMVSHTAPPGSAGTFADQLLEARLKGLGRLVGNTPLLEIVFRFRGRTRTLFAKAETFNFTGSIKDRMALHILEDAYSRGVLAPGQPIAEATSGNTGIAFCAIGRALGHPVTIFMPDWMSQERKDLIRSFGAEVRLVSREEGGFLGSIRQSEAWADRMGAFLPRQFSNDANVQAHAATTGPELWWQLRFQGRVPEAFVAGVGTGGTVMGVGRYLRSVQKGIRIHPMEPANSPTLRTGCKAGHHRIQGISDEFIPAVVKLEELDGIIDVEDGDAIRMAQRLASQLGLGVGISSGGNFLAALKVQEELGPEAVVATVFSDSNKKYLSTDLLKEESSRPDHLSSQVELLYFKACKRVCHTCCEPDDCVERLQDAVPLPPCPRRPQR